jgi:hypothetical protein
MNLDERTARAVDAARRQAASADRPDMGAVGRARRVRSGIGVAAGAFLVVLVVGGFAALVSPSGAVPDVAGGSTVPPTQATTAVPTTAAATTAPATSVVPAAGFTGSRWTVNHPPTWQRANSDLMPNLGWESMTLASFPLRPGGANCAQVPENALRDLGPQDVLLSVFFSGTAPADSTPWPVEGFDDAVFPVAESTDAHGCSGRPGLEIHWGLWDHSGEGLYVLAAFGDEVTEQRRSELWATLGSLELRAAGDGGRTCVVTAPSPPGFTPPATYPAEPVFGLWYGTADLWTVLESDGSYGIRKSVWWSANFPGGEREERPDLTVTWRRLDADEPIRTSDGATNAFTADEGWFIIAGIDPEEGGCWEITASYKGATLSYVAVIES